MPSRTGHPAADALPAVTRRTLADLVGDVRILFVSMPCEAFTPLARRQTQDKS